MAPISEAIKIRLSEIRHVALDMDGTIYKGATLFPFTPGFLQKLKVLGIGYTFLTNNSSRNRRDYLAHLAGLGISASPEELYTSTDATLAWLGREQPKVKRLFLLGTGSLGAEFKEAQYQLCADDPSDEPDAVVVGFDTSLVFSRLCRAAYWISQGKPFIATHPDAVCPTDAPTVLVDCGSICAALEKATNRRPDVVLGKPDISMIRGILERHGLEVSQLAVAGDRLYTDMAMARRAGAMGILVLTGETTEAQAARTESPADLIVSDLAEFGNWLQAARSN